MSNLRIKVLCQRSSKVNKLVNFFVQKKYVDDCRIRIRVACHQKVSYANIYLFIYLAIECNKLTKMRHFFRVTF